MFYKLFSSCFPQIFDLAIFVGTFCPIRFTRSHTHTHTHTHTMVVTTDCDAIFQSQSISVTSLTLKHINMEECFTDTPNC